MPGWWSANDFRHARMALIGVSAASFVPLVAPQSGALAIPVAGVLHLGLLASLAFEGQPWPARIFGAVLLLPSSSIAAFLAGMAIWVGGREPVLVTAALAFALSHLAQLWRLAGLPIPPLHPLAAPVTDDFFHPQAAPERGAERIAVR